MSKTFKIGDTVILKKIATSLDIKVSIIPILKDNQGRLSSSRVRKALNNGELKTTFTGLVNTNKIICYNMKALIVLLYNAS